MDFYVVVFIFAVSCTGCYTESTEQANEGDHCHVPGVQYPNYQLIPETSFNCSEQKTFPGFYADEETGCQVYHVCARNGRQGTLLCPEMMIFNQKILRCDTWFNFNCSDAASLYDESNSMFQYLTGRGFLEPNVYRDDTDFSIVMLMTQLKAVLEVTEAFGEERYSPIEDVHMYSAVAFDADVNNPKDFIHPVIFPDHSDD